MVGPASLRMAKVISLFYHGCGQLFCKQRLYYLQANTSSSHRMVLHQQKFLVILYQKILKSMHGSFTIFCKQRLYCNQGQPSHESYNTFYILQAKTSSRCTCFNKDDIDFFTAGVAKYLLYFPSSTNFSTTNYIAGNVLWSSHRPFSTSFADFPSI